MKNSSEKLVQSPQRWTSVYVSCLLAAAVMSFLLRVIYDDTSCIFPADVVLPSMDTMDIMQPIMWLLSALLIMGEGQNSFFTRRPNSNIVFYKWPKWSWSWSFQKDREREKCDVMV